MKSLRLKILSRQRKIQKRVKSKDTKYTKESNLTLSRLATTTISTIAYRKEPMRCKNQYFQPRKTPIPVDLPGDSPKNHKNIL